MEKPMVRQNEKSYASNDPTPPGDSLAAFCFWVTRVASLKLKGAKLTVRRYDFARLAGGGSVIV